MNVRRSSTGTFAFGLVKIHKVSTIKIFSGLVRDKAAERGRAVPDTELRLLLVECVNLMRGCIPTIPDVY